MIKRTVTTAQVLESRLAALFVQTAGKFSSKITIAIEDRVVNAKSIMGVISLGVLDNQLLTIITDGDDEAEAMDELTAFLAKIHPE